MAGVWIITEKREQAKELLGVARMLADEMGTTVMAVVPKGGGSEDEFIIYGADEVLLMPELAPEQSFADFLPVIAENAKAVSPDLISFIATVRGKEMAAKLAARMSCALCSGCTSLSFEKGSGTIVMERLVYGGAAIQKLTSSARPVIITFPPRTFDAARSQEGRQGKIRELPVPAASTLRIIERKAKDKIMKDITEARVIVCAGRGFDKKEDLELARKLAEALGGELGATKPLTEEMHWLPEDLCIGLSGVQVKPELYVGLGVSGQVQHMTGVRSAKVVCAVNRDENAFIFPLSDFGIVGNLYDVVPKLIEALKR